MSVYLPKHAAIALLSGGLSLAGFSVQANVVPFYDIGKMAVYEQQADSSRLLDEYRAYVHVEEGADPIDAISISGPGFVNEPLLNAPGSSSWDLFEGGYATEAALNAAVPNGAYSLDVVFADSSSESRPVFVDPGINGFPSQIPMINNHTAGDTLTLTPVFEWDQWINPLGDPDIDVFVGIYQEDGQGGINIVLNTVVLDASENSFSVASGLLSVGQTYFFQVGFHSYTALNGGGELGMDSFSTLMEFEFDTPFIDRPVPIPATWGLLLGGLVWFG